VKFLKGQPVSYSEDGVTKSARYVGKVGRKHKIRVQKKGGYEFKLVSAKQISQAIQQD